MAIFKAQGNQTTSVVRESEGNDVFVKALRDGTLTMADWIGALCIEGRVFCANAGTVTGPLTFGAGSITETEADLHVVVPSGTTIIPIELCIQIEAFGNAAIFEILAEYGTGSTAGTDSTAVTPANLNINSSYASSCTVVGASTVTGGTAFTGNKVEFFRAGHIKAQTPVTTLLNGSTIQTKFRWSARESGYYPIVVGASQLAVFAAAQASTGFITLVYAELPSSVIT